MEISKINSKNLFASIRMANRLTYEYQKRILEFVSYFQMKFGLEPNQIAGCKLDSDALSKTRAYSEDYPDANLRIWTDMWAWDFIYTNLMEYYMGWTQREKHKFCMSFVQMTDSGLYESIEQKKSWTKLKSYAEVEKSHSYGFFVIECVKTNVKKIDFSWNVDRDGMEKWVKSVDDIVEYKENDKSKYMVFRFNMEDITNQQSVDAILLRFSDIVKQKIGINLVATIDIAAE